MYVRVSAVRATLRCFPLLSLAPICVKWRQCAGAQPRPLFNRSPPPSTERQWRGKSEHGDLHRTAEMHRDFNPYRLLRILHVKSLLWIRRQLLPSQQPSFTNLIFSPSSMLVLIRKSRRGCQGCSLKKLKGFCRLHPTRYPILHRARIAWNWAFHAQNSDHLPMDGSNNEEGYNPVRNNRGNGYDIMAGHISDISRSNHSQDILYLEVMISS